ncbi:hypothetical protein FZC84_01990 [Rossellomorea vietnamensis]|uniref:Cxxc_20_cxxc protein n=1 Tax=Rossellomorea vietnamensis TaxID=218284 RepID=A0A5D4MKC9_9BACI|nr:TIGR04104 family putative zinc finger protein [Rossellomorea vietnamensis]TYS01446.1 hypothetical protein FZC84_01990 [Rossellomorea vietnamensis]
MGLPKCGECGVQLSWWKVFKDISYETWQNKTKIKCSYCGTNNTKRRAQVVFLDFLLIIGVATLTTFSDMNIWTTLFMVFLLSILFQVSLPFFIEYEPEYLEDF